jgi:hypothetical protein
LLDASVYHRIAMERGAIEWIGAADSHMGRAIVLPSDSAGRESPAKCCDLGIHPSRERSA